MNVWRNPVTTGQVVPEWPVDVLELTPGDVVAMVAQQLEVMGHSVALTKVNKTRAEAVAAALLDALGSGPASQVR